MTPPPSDRFVLIIIHGSWKSEHDPPPTPPIITVATKGTSELQYHIEHSLKIVNMSQSQTADKYKSTPAKINVQIVIHD